MKTYIALFRGINVVGNNKLPMKDLARLLEGLGCADVRTYIQSGNAILRSGLPASRLASSISAAIARRHGFEPRVLMLTPGELGRAIAGNPFPEAHAVPTSVHLFFLTARARAANLEAMSALASAGERFALEGRVFYLHTPAGFGTSKVSGRVERLLGVPATARNWRTCTTLLEMSRAQGHR
jgi:uncharacterized protein (DUF1697 family)